MLIECNLHVRYLFVEFIILYLYIISMGTKRTGKSTNQVNDFETFKRILWQRILLKCIQLVIETLSLYKFSTNVLIGIYFNFKCNMKL